jgi:ribosome-binding factor A
MILLQKREVSTMTRRAERISSLIRQDIGELLQAHTNDPRLKTLISVTQVQTSADLKNAKISVSVLGDKKQQEDALKAFRSAARYFRHELAQRLTTRVIPELTFELDQSIERGVRISNLIDQVVSEDAENARARDTESQ